MSSEDFDIEAVLVALAQEWDEWYWTKREFKLIPPIRVEWWICHKLHAPGPLSQDQIGTSSYLGRSPDSNVVVVLVTDAHRITSWALGSQGATLTVDLRDPQSIQQLKLQIEDGLRGASVK